MMLIDESKSCYILYSRKFSRKSIFTFFVNQAQSAKILPSKIIIWPHLLNIIHIVVKKCRKMALYKYLTSLKPPNPNSFLSKLLPSLTIAFAFFKVSKVFSFQDLSGDGKRRGSIFHI